MVFNNNTEQHHISVLNGSEVKYIIFIKVIETFIQVRTIQREVRSNGAWQAITGREVAQCDIINMSGARMIQCETNEYYNIMNALILDL